MHKFAGEDNVPLWRRKKAEKMIQKYEPDQLEQKVVISYQRDLECNGFWGDLMGVGELWVGGKISITE